MFRAFAYIASLPPLWTNGDWEFVKQFVCKNSAICKVFLFWDFYQIIGLWQLRIIKIRAFSYSKSAMIKRKYLHNSSQCAPAFSNPDQKVHGLFTFILQLHMKQFKISWKKYLTSGFQKSNPQKTYFLY